MLRSEKLLDLIRVILRIKYGWYPDYWSDHSIEACTALPLKK